MYMSDTDGCCRTGLAASGEVLHSVSAALLAFIVRPCGVVFSALIAPWLLMHEPRPRHPELPGDSYVLCSSFLGSILSSYCN